ncbi:hypothetical protein E4U09_001870 [Claviceps aff. purpurea]|uniref:Uncharacterized protein n=1 Tax=Claviceps aff. purpurea TaxID=1967640 RepID=A0A9P7QIJ7_9HYPO|nr:hypothetical protein E4U09_001870 [Claviceps aff. purpurea]
MAAKTYPQDITVFTLPHLDISRSAAARNIHRNTPNGSRHTMNTMILENHNNFIDHNPSAVDIHHIKDTTIPENHHSSTAPIPTSMKIHVSTRTLRRCTTLGGNSITTQDLKGATNIRTKRSNNTHNPFLLGNTIKLTSPKDSKSRQDDLTHRIHTRTTDLKVHNLLPPPLRPTTTTTTQWRNLRITNTR